MDLPRFALSVRQPWAWAIIHGGKDIENRSWKRPNPGLAFRGRCCIHASKGMTRDEFEGAGWTFADCGIASAPAAHDLQRGGIIGHVEIVDVVLQSDSPWFFGWIGLVLRDPVAVPFIRCDGQLGFFEWRAGEGDPEPPARWMLPASERPKTKAERASEQGRMF